MLAIPLASGGRVNINSLNLYYEAFGNLSHPAVLLIMGLASQSLQWFPYFYEPIVERGYYVIRFDPQFTAIQRSGSRLQELSSIAVPTLVVHGNEDPLIPEAHASVYAQQLPKATYLALDGVGHEIVVKSPQLLLLGL